ncbi:MAG TPA: GNAT family N-acetyltransferase [Pseudomonadales bacterium]|nr:GNAT family N-acetyltransferase [Pseudomonadales bacterium]
MEHFTTTSGRPLVIRGMSPDDREREMAFVSGLSDRARRLRFLSSMKELSPSLLKRFTNPDPACETVLVALDPDVDAIVAVGRFAIDDEDDRCAEFALVVADAWRREGLGLHLMHRLIDDGRRRGLAVIAGLVLAENRDMRRLLERLGFDFRMDADDPSLAVARLSLAASD